MICTHEDCFSCPYPDCVVNDGKERKAPPKKRGRKPMGWGRVLDYIGIPWRNPEHWYLETELKGQMNIFDFIGGNT